MELMRMQYHKENCRIFPKNKITSLHARELPLTTLSIFEKDVLKSVNCLETGHMF